MADQSPPVDPAHSAPPPSSATETAKKLAEQTIDTARDLAKLAVDVPRDTAKLALSEVEKLAKKLRETLGD